MNIKKNITINLSENDLKEIVAYYLSKEGFSVRAEDVVFSVGTCSKGYGMNEHEATYFEGCSVSCTK